VRFAASYLMTMSLAPTKLGIARAYAKAASSLEGEKLSGVNCTPEVHVVGW